MRKRLLVLFRFLMTGWGAMLCLTVPAQAADGQTAKTAASVMGRWMVTADFTGTPIYFQLELTQDGEKLSGKFGGDKLEGSLKGNVIQFVAKDEQGSTSEMKGALEAGLIVGSMVFTDVNDTEHPETHSIKAEIVPQRPAGLPKRHDFVPTTFYRQFSPFNKPVLTVAPGDTIHTTTVDAGGVDEKE